MEFLLFLLHYLIAATNSIKATDKSAPPPSFVVDDFLLKMWQYQCRIRWMHMNDDCINLDKRLSENAKNWAQRVLQSMNSGSTITSHSSRKNAQLKSEFIERAGRDYAENVMIFTNISSPPTNLAYEVLHGTGPPPGWYTSVEQATFNYTYGTPTEIEKVLWRATDYFGCGVASHAKTIIVVCHYFPLESYHFAADRLINLRKKSVDRPASMYEFRNLTDQEVYSISRSKHLLVVFQESILHFLQSMEYKAPGSFKAYWILPVFRPYDRRRPGLLDNSSDRKYRVPASKK